MANAMQLLDVTITIKRDGFVVSEVTRTGPDACTPAEVEVLKMIHGPDNVIENRHVGYVLRAPMQEKERLKLRYCKKPDTRGLVDTLFPGLGNTVPSKSQEIHFPPLDEHEQEEDSPRFLHVGPAAAEAPDGDLDAMSEKELKEEFRRRGIPVPTGPVKRETLLAKLNDAHAEPV